MSSKGTIMQYNAIAPYEPNFDRFELVDLLLDRLAPFSAVAAAAPDGRTQAIIRVDARDLDQATDLELRVLTVAGLRPVALEVLTTADFDRRGFDVPIPALMSLSEVAAALGITRQAVLQRVQTGALPAVRVGRTWAVARAGGAQEMSLSVRGCSR